MHHGTLCGIVRIPFASSKHATIAKQSIEVDAELQPQAVKRTITVEEDVLNFQNIDRPIIPINTKCFLGQCGSSGAYLGRVWRKGRAGTITRCNALCKMICNKQWVFFDLHCPYSLGNAVPGFIHLLRFNLTLSLRPLLLVLFILAQVSGQQRLQFLIFKLLFGLYQLGFVPDGRMGDQRRTTRQ